MNSAPARLSGFDLAKSLIGKSTARKLQESSFQQRGGISRNPRPAELFHDVPRLLARCLEQHQDQAEERRPQQQGERDLPLQQGHIEDTCHTDPQKPDGVEKEVERKIDSERASGQRGDNGRGKTENPKPIALAVRGPDRFQQPPLLCL